MHFRDFSGEILPAMITRTSPTGGTRVGLTVFHYNKMPSTHTSVEQGDGEMMWFWPPRG